MKKSYVSISILCIGLILSDEIISKAQTATFNYTGAVQMWTVPPCVSQVTITSYGAQGGGAGGGLGGEAVATIPVTSGTILNIYVGGNPTAQIGPGGYNGGGASTMDPCGGPPNDGYPGGGGSDVRIPPYTLAERIIVAGGGGGQGWSSGAGGSGGGLNGLPGAASWIAGAPQGYGGTQSAGGAGGTYMSDTPFATDGSLGQGGDADAYSGFCTGGGGGGGYYGGGGGYVNPGGGGSSYISYPGSTFTSTTTGVQTGNGQIIITWAADSLTSAVANVISNVSCNGGNNGSANAVVTGGTGTYTYTWAPGGGTNATQSGLTAGTYTLTASDSCGMSKTATVTITEPAVLAVTKGSVASWISNCNGVAYVTVSGGTAPYTYMWSPSGGNKDTAKGLCAGSYCCTVTDSNGCKDSVCLSVVTGIPVINNASLISIFPDPNNGYFTISGLTKGFTVEVYNYLGQKVSSILADKATMQFNISDKANGEYLVRILSEDGKPVKEARLVKEK